MGKITPLVKAAVISLILVVFISFVLPASNSALREISYKNLTGVEHVMPVLEHKPEKPSTEYHNKSAAVAAPVVNINSKTNASCSDNADGSININVTGGTEPYSFSWTGPGSFSSSNEDISNLSEGPYSVTVTDDDGNSSTPKSTTIAVEDNEDPTVRTQNITVQLDANGNATISAGDIDNGSTDNCQIQSRSLNITNFDCSNVGDNSVELTVTDVNGNSAKKTATVTVEDEIDPTVRTQNITVQLDANGTATISAEDIDNGSTDNCQIQSRSLNITNFNCSNVGDNSVELTVTDVNGNSAKKTATVTVEDDIVPTVRTQDITVQLDANGNVTISAEDIDNGSTDNCQIQSRSLNITNFDCNDVGDNSVELTVTDVNGNSAKKTATVTVEDDIAPTVRTQDITVQLDSNGNATISAEDIDNGSGDNCQIQSRSLNITNFNCSNVGDNSVELTVTDVNGNSASENATITVEDNIKPVTPTLQNITWSCGEDVEIPTTTDNCSGVITATTSAPLQYNTFGTYIIPWEFTDEAENSITVEQTIIIPEPTVNPVDDIVVCNGETISALNFTGSSVEGTTYQWTSNNTTIGTPAGGSDQITSFEARNTTNEIITAEFVVTPVANNCEGESISFSITVNPTPTITVPNNIEVCTGAPIDEINLSNFSVDGTSVSWENDNPDIGLTSSGTGNIASFTAQNTRGQNIIAKISLTPAANNCEGEVQTFKITVKPDPVLTVPEFPELCNGASTATPIALQGNFSGITYDITGGSSIGLSNRANVTEIPAFTPANNTNTPVTATIVITPKANGCTGDAVEIPVTVKPSPVVNTSFTGNICSGEITDIQLTGPVANTSYTWTINAPGGVEGATDGSLNANGIIEQELINTTLQPQTVTYRITPEADGCVGATIPVNVVVNPLPVIDFKNAEALCSPTDLTTLELAEGSTTGLNFTFWKNGIQVQNPRSVEAGSYEVRGKNTAGCITNKSITVNPSPQVNLPSGAVEACSQQAFDYEFSTTNTDTIAWRRVAHRDISDNSSSSGTGDITETLNNTSNNPIEITYLIELTSADNCIAEEELKVKVYPAPKLSNLPLEDELPFIMCGGDSFSFTPQSTAPGANFRWERAFVQGIDNSAKNGNGAINERLVNTTSEAITVFYKIYVDASTCSNPTPYDIPVLVQPAPIVETQLALEGSSDKTESIEICPGGSFVDLYSTSDVPEGLGDGETSQAPQTGIIEAWDFSNPNDRNKWRTPKSTTNNVETQWGVINNGDPGYRDNYPNGDGPNPNNRYYGLHYFSYPSGNNPFFGIATPSLYKPHQNTSLVSPGFSTVGYSNVTLSFQHAYRNGDNPNGEKAELQVSFDGGNTWTTRVSYQGFLGSKSEFVEGRTPNGQQITIEGNHPNVKLRFAFSNNYSGENFWAISNVKIEGEGSSGPKITWTSSTDPDWYYSTPNNTANLKSVGPINRETVFTATYSYDGIECDGTSSVTVKMKETPQPKINANYCYSDESNTILLSADKDYDEYQWTSSGEFIDDSKSIEVNTAQEYTLKVWKNGCSNSTTLNLSGNLITNGDFESEDPREGFNTAYRFVQNDPSRQTEFYEEGIYAIDDDSNKYHHAFDDNGDHTSGTGNFMIVNGDTNLGRVVWETDLFEVKENTDYYFSAWTMNIDTDYVTEKRNFAQLRILVLAKAANGTEVKVAESTLGDLWDEENNRGLPAGEWLQFYSPTFWNSGSYTQARLQIINDNDYDQGNDFGIDDISFAELSAVNLEFNVPEDQIICEGETIYLETEITEGGRLPVTFDWTGPDNFQHAVTATTDEELAEALTLIIPEATPAMAGEYSLKITDFYGCDIAPKSTTVQIPSINAGEDFEICATEAVENGIPLAANISGQEEISGTWYLDGVEIPTGYDEESNLFTATYTAETFEAGDTITFTFSSETGCTDEVQVIVNGNPVVNLESENLNCFGQDNGEIAAMVSGGSGSYSFEWNNGQTTQTATNLTAGTYWVTVKDEKACIAVSDTITILEPQQLVVGSPVQLEEASCYDEYSAVVAIPVSGGLFEGETIDPENIPYSVEILNAAGDKVILEEENFQYEIENELFIFSGLQGGTAYSFLINTSENCNAVIESFTTITPPEINAGEAPANLDCGVKTIWLSATPIDPELGTGSWSYNGGQTELLGDASQPNTTFTGEPGLEYTLTWTVNSSVNENCSVPSDPLVIKFPPACSQLNFDGQDDFVDLGNHYNMEGNTFSLEAWVKPHDLSGTRTIFSKREEDNLNSGYDLILNNGSPVFRVGNKSVSSNKKLNTNRWFHIAGVYSGQQVLLYVDGIEIQTSSNISSNAVVNNSAPAIIGAAYASSISGSKNNFAGYIEELRIWNTPISEGEIRFMMNQRIKTTNNPNPTDPIDGEIIAHRNIEGSYLKDNNGYNLYYPKGVDESSKRWYNQKWENLVGYYQLLAEQELIANGYTDNLGYTAPNAHGLLKNIDLMQENSAPLPYISNQNGEWFNSATWLHSDVWEPPNSIGLDRTTKIDWNIVRLKHNVENPATTNNKNSITVLGLLSENGTFNMLGDHGAGANGNGIGTGNALTITHYLKLDGFIDLNGESQLIQSEGSILDVTSSGYIQKDQQGTKNSYNYNYWSSPVSKTGAANNSGFTIASVLRDGSDAENPKEITFGGSHTFADGNYSENLRISSYWLNIFHGTADAYGVWKQINANTNLETATGYTMKGPSGSARISDLQNYVFQGKPNNGTVSIEISDHENRLVGNPYPSAISAREFILDNLRDVNGGRNNKNVFNGTLYFWDHFGEENTHVLAEYVGGYAAYNLTGGVPGVSNDRRINNSGNHGGSKKPKSAIPAGQGFFINTILDQTVAQDITIHGGDVLFKNNQRLYGRKHPSNGNSQFLRPIYPQKESKASDPEDGRQKIRINFTSPKGYHRQLLVAADPLATNGFDLGYDAPMMDYNAEDMFWVINGGEFVIQAVADFDLEQVLPVGLVTAEEGEFKIEIAELENIPDEMEIYLRNTEDSTYHDLRTKEYEASIEAGYFPEKYELVFQKKEQTEEEENPEEEEENSEEDESPEEGEEENPEEGNENPDAENPKENPEDENGQNQAGISVEYLMNRKQLVIYNPGAQKIDEVRIFTLNGQQLETFNEATTEKEIYLTLIRPVSTSVYIVKVHTAEKVYNKKIIVKK